MTYEKCYITPKWYYIGLQLGLKPNTDLDPIRSQNSDPLQCTCNVVKQWLKISPHPTCKDLVDALSSSLVCEEYRANRLRLKYCETSTTRKDVSQTSEDSVQAVWARGKLSIEVIHTQYYVADPLVTALSLMVSLMHFSSHAFQFQNSNSILKAKIPWSFRFQTQMLF